ncbi:MAG: hypothetical protein WA705_02320 [Candidatus Ozemobacteraceae bacterium]
MKKPTHILIMVLFLFTTIALSARPGNDPNAATRYLLAIGQLPNVTEKVLDDVGLIEKFEDFGKIGKDGTALLADEKFRMAMRMLKLGAACPTCNFTPDDTQSFDDPVPPFRRIRQLARLARAYAWDREKAGDLAETVETLTATFMLGQHVEENGILISTMIGVACRKIAANALLEFRSRHPETEWKEKLAIFFKRIPQPSADIKASLKYERDGVEKALRKAKSSPEIFRSCGLDSPEAASSSVPATAAPDKECRATQRVIVGGIEMLLMDYPLPLPATITADLSQALFTLKYLKKPVACPEGGKISIVLNDKGGADTECSRHGTVDTPSAQAKQADNDKKDASFNYYSKLAATPEYDRLVDECMKFYDEMLALDLGNPAVQPAYDALWKKIEGAKNPFASAVIPNFRKAGEEARKLEGLIEQLKK